MGRLEGKRVLITGASGGIGFVTSGLMAREGARLALVARGRSGLDEAVRIAASHGAEAHAIEADVADREAVERAVRQAVERLGGLDVLVSNAGAAVFGPFDEISAKDFDRTVAVTFTGAVNAVRAALPELERSGGTIVANVSTASRSPVSLQSPYAAAKHALRGFLGTLRVELRNKGSDVRVSMVHPSPIDTPFWNNATSAVGTHGKPLRSVYRPETVAEALVECAVRPRAEVTVGSSGLALDLLAAVARPLSDLALSTYGVWGQRTDEPAREPGALWEPTGTGEVSGGFPARPSLSTALRLMSLRPLLPRRG